MTIDRATELFKYLRVNYRNIETDDKTMSIWINFFSEFQYEGMAQAIKLWVAKGNKFPPTTGELEQNYSVKLTFMQQELLDLMEIRGEFYDDIGTDEIKKWNHDQRKQKAKLYITGILPMPDWFKSKYEQHKLAMQKNNLLE